LGCENVFKCFRFQKAVKCMCGIKFCSKCRNEKHYPVPCDILKRIFGLKESNDHWVNLNTTSCPKCGRFV
jgi:acetone carboxylase gamma subunit